MSFVIESEVQPAAPLAEETEVTVAASAATPEEAGNVGKYQFLH